MEEVDSFKMPGMPAPPQAKPRKLDEVEGQGSTIPKEADGAVIAVDSETGGSEREQDKSANPNGDGTQNSSNGSTKSAAEMMMPPSKPPSRSKESHSSTSGGKDATSKEEWLALKKAKYAELLKSLKYHPPQETGATKADSRYSLEVLKTGTVVGRIKFKEEDGKGFYIVGRMPASDVFGENPTVSRTHAILQFIESPKGTPDSTSTDNTDEDGDEGGVPRQTGLYLYDLNSTHGTFINKSQVFPNRYYRLRVGYVLKFGNSTRLYIVHGPSEDEEAESEKSVTELQNEKLQRELERKKLEEQGILIKTKSAAGEGEDGCSWGMADDADEESDLRENPFAMNFEESEGFDNPKKTLRGWFEREGYELVYDCREKAPGQFICRINLPIDGPGGQPVFAEVDVKGKKKESVHQAALQACQILDKYGVLRQSHHESKAKKKEKDWEDQDFYSSDEDTFLDRTGSVEKKREMRMKIAGKIEDKAETYESLSEKAAVLQKEITLLESQIKKAQNSNDSGEDIDIDDYVKMLKSGAADVKKMKSKLRETSEELKRVKKLLNIAKPASLPVNLVTETKPAIPTTVQSSPLSSSSLEIKKDDITAAATVKEETLTESSKELKITKQPIPNVEVDKKPTEEIESRKRSASPNSKSPGSSTGSSAPKQPKLFGPRLPMKPPADLLKLEKPVKAKSGEKMEVEEAEEDASSEDDEAKNPSGDESDEDPGEAVTSTSEGASKPKKKRIRQRHQKPKKEDKFDYDASDPKYSTWVPPKDQQGDGRTSLNEKLGY